MVGVNSPEIIRGMCLRALLTIALIDCMARKCIFYEEYVVLL